MVWAGLLPCLVAIATAALCVPAVAGAQTTPTTTTTTAASVSLLGQDDWIGPRGTFHLQLRTVTPADGYILDVRLLQPVGSVDELLGGEEPSGTSRVRDRLFRTTLSTGGENHTIETVVVPEADNTFGYPQVLDPGIFPIAVQLLDPEGERVSYLVTYLVHLPEVLTTTALDVGLLADLRSDPQRDGDGRARLDSAETGRLQSRLDALGAFPDVPATLQLQPETVSALTETRAGSGGAALSSLERVAGATSQGTTNVVGATFVGFDEAGWLADQHADVVRAELDAGRATLAGAQLRTERQTVALQHPADDAMLAQLVANGVDRVVLPTSEIDGARGAGLVTLGVGPRRTGQASLVALPGASTAFVPRAGRPLDAVDAHRLLAALLYAPIEGDLSSRQLRLGADLDFTSPFLSTLLSTLARGGPIRARSVDQLFAVHPAEDLPALAGAGAAAPSGRSGARSSTLAQVNLRVAGLYSVLADDALTAGLEARLLLVPASALPDGTAQELMDGVDRAIHTVIDGVKLPAQQAFTITSHRTSLPLVIRNDSDRTLNVRLVPRSGELEFPGDVPVLVALPPGATDLEIPIQTRRSGEFDFTIAVMSPDQGLTLGEVQVRVQSRAISGVGVLLSAGALLFLVVWWVRNHRRRTRARQFAAQSTPMANAPPATASALADAMSNGSASRHRNGAAPAEISQPSTPLPGPPGRSG